jgi:hypothetical protein
LTAENAVDLEVEVGRAPQRALEPPNRVAGGAETDGRLSRITHALLQVSRLLDATPHAADVAQEECLRAGARVMKKVTCSAVPPGSHDVGHTGT